MQDRQNISLTQSQQLQQNSSFCQDRNSYVVEGINNANEISNFNCEWIDNEESPQKVTQQRFPSDIEIGLDGLNIGSGHHLQTNHIEFNFQGDESINNEYEQDEYFIRRKSKAELQDNSILSNHSFARNYNGNMLEDELQLLNDSKQGHCNNILEVSQRNDDENIFDNDENLISEIQPPSLEILQQASPKQFSGQENDLNKKNENTEINIIQPIESESSILEDKKSLQNNQQTNQTLSGQQTLKSEGNKSKSSLEKESTIVINQNSFVSKIYDDMSSIQQTKLLKSMSNYLQSDRQVYNPLHSMLESIFTNSKTKSEKSMQNFNMYNDFFKEKSKQLEKYLREMQSQKTEKLFQNLKTKEINNMVYIDSKVVLRDIHQKNIRKVKLCRVFYKQILQVSTDLKKIISDIHTKRSQSQKSISSLLSTVKSLQGDLDRLIEYRFNYQRQKSDPSFHINTKQLFKVDNPHIVKDHYLQIKFIIENQVTYIKKLKILKTQVIKYITMVFLTDQILLSSKIKENLMNYTEMLIEVQKMQRSLKSSQENENYQQEQSFQKHLQTLQSKKDTLSQKKIHQELKRQLAKKLFECIPQILRNQLGINEFDSKITSEQLLQMLNSHFQNEVFFPNIELEDQFIFYKAEGGWLSRDEYKALEIAGKKQIKAENSLKFVLTVNKYLHMEQNQKIATIKLNEIKISKKGKFIIISDRGKGIVGFLVNNGNELGRIQLNSQEEADRFAEKVKELVQQK